MFNKSSCISRLGRHSKQPSYCHSKLDLESSTHIVAKQNNNQSGRSRIKYGMTPNFKGGGPGLRPSGAPLRSGFTLIELLLVVLIIGILASVALPQYQTAVTKSRYATLKNVVHALAMAEEVYYMENGSYTEDLTELVLGAAGCEPTDNPRQCLYSWGHCQVKSGSGSSEYCASCTSNQIHMQYRVYFKHSVALPGKRMCLASNRDLSSVQNKICKAETNATTPGTGTTNAYTWIYK